MKNKVNVFMRSTLKSTKKNLKAFWNVLRRTDFKSKEAFYAFSFASLMFGLFMFYFHDTTAFLLLAASVFFLLDGLLSDHRDDS